MITNLARSASLAATLRLRRIARVFEAFRTKPARALATRRENLTLTRAALTERLEEIEAAKPAVVELAM